MVTEQTRNSVWREFTDQERLVRYYEALSEKYLKWHFWTRFVLSLAAIGGIGALLTKLPDIVQQIAGVLVILVIVWDLVQAPARKAAILHTISIECSRAQIEFKELWAEIDTNAEASEDEIRSKLSRLERRVLEVTSWAGHAGVQAHPKLNEQAERTGKSNYGGPICRVKKPPETGRLSGTMVGKPAKPGKTPQPQPPPKPLPKE